MQKTNNSIEYSEDLWTSEHEWEQWDRVYNAITVRWPSISLGEAKTINRNVSELVKFVSERVDTNIAEIESVVGEFAPEMPSTLNVALRTTLPMMLLGFAALLASYLLATHLPPWTAFHQEVAAAIGVAFIRGTS